MLILEHLAVEYRKKSKITKTIFSDPVKSPVVYPYNAGLTLHWLLDYSEVCLCFDNEAIGGLCKDKLLINPTLRQCNSLISKVVSSATAALRFDGELNVDLGEFQTGLVPFPRIHFHTCAYAPIFDTATNRRLCSALAPSFHKNVSWTLAQYLLPPNPPSGATELAISLPGNRLLPYRNDGLFSDHKMMKCVVNFRGGVSAKAANSAVQNLKSKRLVEFVEWCPTGFKVGLNQLTAPPIPKYPDVFHNSRPKMSCTMLSNDTAFGGYMAERILRPITALYGMRSFVQWFVGEGMEEMEIGEAIEDLEFLEKDYVEVLTEEALDDVDPDDDF